MTVAFSDLWNSYPSEQAPCSNQAGQANFSNQCAIRMGLCLADAGVDLSSCRAVRCWHRHGRRHVLRAQELADWLTTRDGVRQVGAVDRQRATRRVRIADQTYSGRSGIVFFRNFWGRGNQGDHIDLWDGSTNTVLTGATDYFPRSEEVWFWQLP